MNRIVLRKSVDETIVDVDTLMKSIITSAGIKLVKNEIQNQLKSFYSMKNHVDLMNFFERCYQVLDKKLPSLKKLFMFCIRNSLIETLLRLMPQEVSTILQIFFSNFFEFIF
jgi:hypothetical protein